MARKGATLSEVAGPEALRMQRRIEAVYAELYTPTGRLRSGAGEAPVTGLRRSKADAEAAVGRARQELQNFSRPPMVRTGGTIGCWTNANPVGSRMVRSISRSVQRKIGCASGSIVFRDCATEIPG